MPQIRRPLAFATPLATALTASLTAAVAADLPVWGPPAIQLRSNIVDGFNLPPGSSFNSGTVALDDDGSVGMRLLLIGGTGSSGIWRGPGDGTGTVAWTIEDLLLGSDVAFDAAGDLLYEEFDVFTAGIRRLPAGGGAPALVVPPGGPFAFTAFSDPRPGPGTDIIVRGGGSSGNRWVRISAFDQTAYVSEQDAGIGFLFTPDADASGRILGKVRLGSTAGSNPDEIRRYSGPGRFDVLAVDDDGDPASPFTSFDNSVGATPDGRAAFNAGLVGGGRGVFLASDRGIVTIATTADPLVSDISFFAPAANDDGLVVFRGLDAAGLDAVFAGDGTGLVRIIGEHDLIPTDLGEGRIDQNDGSVTFGGGPAIDATGRIAFAATLTPPGNDQIEWGTGVFVVTPAPVFEPADINEDGFVGLPDLLAVLAAWGDGPGPADVDEDGSVGLSDLLAVLAAWSS